MRVNGKVPARERERDGRDGRVSVKEGSIDDQGGRVKSQGEIGPINEQDL